MPNTIPCPDSTCGASAVVVDRWTLESTDGPVAHVRTECARGHVYTPMVESLRLPAVADEPAFARSHAGAPAHASAGGA
jgi:hypothetical protein